MKKNIKYFAIVLILFVIASCQKTMEIYIGMPMQPTNINAEFKPGLNVFGMLSAGDTFDGNNQYFEVHRIVEISDTSSVTVPNARISIKLDGQDMVRHVIHRGEGIYSNQSLQVLPGQKWSYLCVNDTFRIDAETIIPMKPIILPESLIFKNAVLSFSILADTSAFMYDIYFLQGFENSDNVLERIIPKSGENTKVEFEIPTVENSNGGVLFVTAYDQNYEKYVSTANRFFKPNAFRPRFSTVTGGYGCFGSSCSLMLDFGLGRSSK